VSAPDLGNPQVNANFVRVASVLGAVVPIYNLGGLTQDVRFTPEVLAGIYLGKIKKWNDPEIRKANEGVDLPGSDIVVIHRDDGSGTTYAWSDFLSKVSPDWKTAIGTGTRLKWPTGTGVEGNEGVASAVGKTPNSIGYVEMVYAIQHQLSFGAVRNSAGEFIRASLDSLSGAAKIMAASSNAALPSITNPPGRGVYPIATFTWLLLPQEIADNAKKAALLELLRWVLTDGQKECSALGYAPLPREVADRELESLKTLK
jgi:phosphate transport system substrate-binding protein